MAVCVQYVNDRYVDELYFIVIKFTSLTCRCPSPPPRAYIERHTRRNTTENQLNSPCKVGYLDWITDLQVGKSVRQSIVIQNYVNGEQ